MDEAEESLNRLAAHKRAVRWKWRAILILGLVLLGSAVLILSTHTWWGNLFGYICTTVGLGCLVGWSIQALIAHVSQE